MVGATTPTSGTSFIPTTKDTMTTTLNDLLADTDMIAVGSVPLKPGIADYADSDGKAVMFVRDMPEGRSLFLGLSLYGEISRMYELDYAAWEDTMLKMTTDVTVHNMGDKE